MGSGRFEKRFDKQTRLDGNKKTTDKEKMIDKLPHFECARNKKKILESSEQHKHSLPHFIIRVPSSKTTKDYGTNVLKYVRETGTEVEPAISLGNNKHILRGPDSSASRGARAPPAARAHRPPAVMAHLAHSNRLSDSDVFFVHTYNYYMQLLRVPSLTDFCTLFTRARARRGPLSTAASKQQPPAAYSDPSTSITRRRPFLFAPRARVEMSTVRHNELIYSTLSMLTRQYVSVVLTRRLDVRPPLLSRVKRTTSRFVRQFLNPLQLHHNAGFRADQSRSRSTCVSSRSLRSPIRAQGTASNHSTETTTVDRTSVGG
ncbi:hypothetical protein EVAR_61635_1 [Eumeta japonica]|uniref:Uncharacterized protein n=1 Tax=Eumeta variegata TaxID=151549 RepID=A0A4C1Z4H9_EUMVA|nr:hypothetical protein EVAR_61635_1 [Eumeta japonica]